MSIYAYENIVILFVDFCFSLFSKMAESRISGTEAVAPNTVASANIRDITKCSRCQYQLQDPQTFLCLHSFCKQCLVGIEKSEKDDSTGYECPQCQSFTPEKDIHVHQFLVELLNAQKLAKNGPQVAKCELCESRNAKWYCRQCKKRNWMCDQCKNQHDKFVEHEVFTLENLKEEHIMLGKPRYCTEHVEHKLELYCIQCKKTLCLLCKIKEHDDHKAEPINDTGKRMLPQIHTDVEKIKEIIKQNQNTVTILDKEKEAAIKQSNKQITEYENKVSKHSQVLAWTTTALAKTTGAALFHHLDTCLHEKIQQVIQSDFRVPASHTLPLKQRTKAPSMKISSDTVASANVRDITKCSRCQYQLQDPKTLRCLHSLCKQCLDGIEKSEKVDSAGYECPQCQSFTPEKDIYIHPLLVELLDAQTLSRNGPQVAKCELCESRNAKWYCRQCKKRNWMCDQCKDQHDKFVEHEVFALENLKEEHIMLGKPLYCTEHVEHKLELYCIQCKKTLCILCKIKEHDDHKSELFNDARKGILPQIYADLEKIKEIIKQTQNTINILDKEKEATITQFNKRIREYENMVSEQSQVLALTTTALAKSTGAALFRHLVSGLHKKIKQVTQSDFRIPASRCWPWEKRTEKPSMKISLDVGSSWRVSRLAIVWDRIWVIHQNVGTVYKFDFDGQKDGEFQLDTRIYEPITAVQVDLQQAVVAANSGLYVINKLEHGNLTEKLQTGDFCDVSFRADGIVYAFEQREGIVFPFDVFNTNWRKGNTIQLENYYKKLAKQYDNTFVVKNDCFYVCLMHTCKIIQYDMEGRELQIIASDGLVQPSICGIDAENSILIVNNITRVNHHHSCLQWIDFSGNILCSVQCSGKRRSSYKFDFTPLFAVYQNEKRLWCIDDHSELALFVHE